MKQTIFLITILIFCSPVFANDGDVFISESKEGIALSFKVISEDEKTVEVTGLAPSIQKENVTGSLTIPYLVEGYKVVAVGEKAFMETNIESLVLSEGIKTVEQLAFSACIRLQSIKLPSTVQNLGYYCFVGCYNLTEVYVFFEQPLHIDYYCDVFDYKVSIGQDYLGHWADGVYDRATLYVPYGTKNEYCSVAPWDYFYRIIEMSPQGGINGDVNGDGVVDISDVVAIISHKAGTESTDRADVNCDGVVDISDIVAAINIIANGPDNPLSNWETLGKGKFTDYFLEDGECVVEILHNKAYPNVYRVEDPYGSFGKSVYDYSRSKYLEIWLLQPGTTILGTEITQQDLVFFTEFNTGFLHSTFGGYIKLYHPAYFYKDETTFTFNKVVKYQNDGTPGLIQMAPLYYIDDVGEINSGLDNRCITIQFPDFQL